MRGDRLTGASAAAEALLRRLDEIGRAGTPVRDAGALMSMVDALVSSPDWADELRRVIRALAQRACQSPKSPANHSAIVLSSIHVLDGEKVPADYEEVTSKMAHNLACKVYQTKGANDFFLAEILARRTDYPKGALLALVEQCPALKGRAALFSNPQADERVWRAMAGPADGPITAGDRALASNTSVHTPEIREVLIKKAGAGVDVPTEFFENLILTSKDSAEANRVWTVYTKTFPRAASYFLEQNVHALSAILSREAVSPLLSSGQHDIRKRAFESLGAWEGALPRGTEKRGRIASEN